MSSEKIQQFLEGAAVICIKKTLQKKERDMSVEEIKVRIQHIIDRMNATGMDTVDPLERFSLRRELVSLYNQSSQISN